MRTLTLESSKIYNAIGNSSLYVYIEDSESNYYINGVPCRLLGKIGDDGIASFQVDEGSFRIYVVASKFLKNYTYDVREIEAGTEDIVLRGKCVIDYRRGKCFYFDGETAPEVKENYKKYNWIILGVALGATVVAFVIAFVISLSVR